MELQQRAMFKMQEYMMKKGPPAHMKPPPEQHKAIQLQMLGHLKQQFKQNKELHDEFEALEGDLRDDKISADEASQGLRNLQQKVMQIKMTEVLEQQQQRIALEK